MVKLNRLLVFLVVIMILLSGCENSNPDYEQEIQEGKYLSRALDELTDAIVHDIFSPPVASRIYAYSTIAAAQIFFQADSSRCFQGKLNGLDAGPEPKTDSNYNHSIASTIAFLEVGKKMVFTKTNLETFEEEIHSDWKKNGIPNDVLKNSISWGKEMAEHIVAWAALDNYAASRSYSKYIINDEPNRWKPTPPAFMDAIEPHWNTIRPFALDSAQQFKPSPPTPFNLNKGSQFMNELEEVYQVMEKDNLDEKLAIAQFWDCNPYVFKTKGHTNFALKKITPGGHWMNITALACHQAKLNDASTAYVLAIAGLSSADAFISCWDEKYRSNLIRPETLINEHMDKDWKPILQTPPFPEHTSGHSVVSSTSAYVLTQLFGNEFSFIDSTEVKYGLPVRSFESFDEAANEAAISRLYGGIHYKPAIEDGLKQGTQIGEFITRKLNIKNIIHHSK